MPGFPCKIGDLGGTLCLVFPMPGFPLQGGLGRYVLNPKPNPETKPPHTQTATLETGGGGGWRGGGEV